LQAYRGVFGRVLVRLDGLAMLSCIEKRFDQLLDEVESLPEESVRMLQKVRDKVSKYNKVLSCFFRKGETKYTSIE